MEHVSVLAHLRRSMRANMAYQTRHTSLATILAGSTIGALAS